MEPGAETILSVSAHGGETLALRLADEDDPLPSPDLQSGSPPGAAGASGAGAGATDPLVQPSGLGSDTGSGPMRRRRSWIWAAALAEDLPAAASSEAATLLVRKAHFTKKGSPWKYACGLVAPRHVCLYDTSVNKCTSTILTC